MKYILYRKIPYKPTMANALIWWHKALSFMSSEVLSIYPGPIDVHRPSNKMSLRPNDRNVLYWPLSKYKYLYQIAHSSLSPQKPFPWQATMGSKPSVAEVAIRLSNLSLMIWIGCTINDDILLSKASVNLVIWKIIMASWGAFMMGLNSTSNIHAVKIKCYAISHYVDQYTCKSILISPCVKSVYMIM